MEEFVSRKPQQITPRWKGLIAHKVMNVFLNVNQLYAGPRQKGGMDNGSSWHSETFIDAPCLGPEEDAATWTSHKRQTVTLNDTYTLDVV